MESQLLVLFLIVEEFLLIVASRIQSFLFKFFASSLETGVLLRTVVGFQFLFEGVDYLLFFCGLELKFFDLFFQSDYPQGFLLLLLLFFTISLHFSCTFLLDLFYFKVLDICAEFTDDRLRFPQGIFLCRFGIKKFSRVDINLLVIISFHLQTFRFAVSTSNNKNINLFLQTVDNPNFLFS